MFKLQNMVANNQQNICNDMLILCFCKIGCKLICKFFASEFGSKSGVMRGFQKGITLGRKTLTSVYNAGLQNRFAKKFANFLHLSWD